MTRLWGLEMIMLGEREGLGVGSWRYAPSQMRIANNKY